MSLHRGFPAAAAVALLVAASAAIAGGDDLFGDARGHLPQFIGIARDVKSFKPIPDMRVVAARKNSTQFFTTFTDAEGRFRIEGFPEDFDPNMVEISCSKTGYKTINVIRRKVSADPKAPVEVECLQQPA